MVFRVNMDKIKKHGSISAYCRKHDLRRDDLYHIDGATWFNEGSNRDALAKKLIKLGVAKWKKK